MMPQVCRSPQVFWLLGCSNLFFVFVIVEGGAANCFWRIVLRERARESARASESERAREREGERPRERASETARERKRERERASERDFGAHIESYETE